MSNHRVVAAALALATVCASFPAEARFLQVDPVGYQAQINLYAYVDNDPTNKVDPTGQRDIYIGGASDKDDTRIVQDYAAAQRRAHPGRDIQYYSWADYRGIVKAMDKPLRDNEPLNVIGHSLGGSKAVVDAAASIGRVTNLITIDPVGTGGGPKPDNVKSWINITAAPKAWDKSDWIAGTGRLTLGTTDTSGAKNSTSDANHFDFGKMMQQLNAPSIINRSYKKMDDALPKKN